MTDTDATYTDLVQAFTTFLTIAIHTILYERHIYPANSFVSARKYNYAVRQSRHPRVCAWVSDAVAAVETEILKCVVDRVAVVIYDARDRPLERFMFDVSRFPIIPYEEVNTALQRSGDQDEEASALPAGDLEEQFRAALTRLSGCRVRLRDIPEGCAFTIAMELRDEAEPPIGDAQLWIPTQPSLPKTVRKDHNGSTAHGGEQQSGTKTVPVRSVAAGEMLLEMWIEEGSAKAQCS